MKALGIIFIIVGILFGVSGFQNTQESEAERVVKNSGDRIRENRQTGEALDNFARALGAGDTGLNSRDYDRAVADNSATYSSMKRERETAMMVCFVAAVGFVVLGLILTVAAPKKA